MTKDLKVTAALAIAKEAVHRAELEASMRPLWDEAMRDLIGAVPKGLGGMDYKNKPDPTRLAELLLAGEQPPKDVLKALGRALLPGKERGHLKLQIKAPPKTKSRAAIISDFVMRQKAREIVAEARKIHEEKHAIGIAAAKLDKKDSWIRETMRMTEEELFQPLWTGKRPRVQKRKKKTNSE